MLLRVEKLSKQYSHADGPVDALKDITFTVKEGNFVTITGPSGSGKSTLLLSLGGLISPSSGDIFFRNNALYSSSNNELAGFRRLAARWMARYGLDVALEWVRFNNAPAPLTLRANTLLTTRDALAARLERDGGRTRACAYAPEGLVVESGRPFASSLAGAGHFHAQDEASQLVGAFVSPPPGSRVADACAAPGGKTAQLAAAIGAGGLLVAGDIRSRRIRLLRHTLRAAHVTTAHLVAHDLLGGWPFGPVFDCVLADVPCSSLGTIRRDPDIRWSRREEDLGALAARQIRMLDQASRGVRPGGLLVYATCSSEPEENEAVLDAFLGSHAGFALEDPRVAGARLPGGVEKCLDERGCLRTLPHRHALEAFFAARLKRRR